jgi:hypothetical protein
MRVAAARAPVPRVPRPQNAIRTTGVFVQRFKRDPMRPSASAVLSLLT